MKQQKPIDWRVLITVILSITILEAIALINGINGTLFSMVMILLGGIAGVSMPQLKLK